MRKDHLNAAAHVVLLACNTRAAPAHKVRLRARNCLVILRAQMKRTGRRPGMLKPRLSCQISANAV
jgi:hypothetical protein